MIKNLIQRTLTGFLFVTVVLLSIYFQKEYYTFSLLFFILTGIGLYEFYRMVNLYEEVKLSYPVLIIAGLVLYTCCFLLSAGLTSYKILFVYALFLVALIIGGLYTKEKKPIHNVAFAFLGQVMIAFPFGILNAIAFEEIHWLFALFILIWVYDSGAYLFGVKFGKHHLCERISPKKTWEGFIGGFIAALLASLIFAHFTPEIAVWKWLLFATFVVVFGTWGDLSESLLKRSVNVKDSGKLLPGHGGILDRFDSCLLLVPIIYFYLQII